MVATSAKWRKIVGLDGTPLCVHDERAVVVRDYRTSSDEALRAHVAGEPACCWKCAPRTTWRAMVAAGLAVRS